MCEVFSGHIVCDKNSKRWGEVIYLSGIHHEKDRGEIYKNSPNLKLAAWTSKKINTLSKGVNIQLSEGNLNKREVDELNKLLNAWVGNQNEEELFLKLVSITQNGKPLARDKFLLDLKNSIFATEESNLVLDFSEIDEFTFDTGYSCTFKTGSSCTFKTGSYCTFDTGSSCTFKTGSYCTFDTGYSCTFDTDSSCTFDTGSSCTFDTGYSCTFDTGYSCTFDTGDYCTFKTGHYCTFDTDKECVCIRRDVYEIIEIPEGKTIRLNDHEIKGFTVIKKG